MWVRISKCLLVLAIAVFALLVGLNNIVDYQSNFMFVQHVLTMDTTFPDNQLLSRAIYTPMIHHLSYWIIIATELATAALCLFGVWQMSQNIHASPLLFNHSKRFASLGLTLGILLWFTGFMTIGAEWFLMWQSQIWNGQQAAFRFIVVLLGTLLFLHQSEAQ